MSVHSSRLQRRAATITRRRLIPALAASAIAAPLALRLTDRRRAWAQTPGATRGSVPALIAADATAEFRAVAEALAAALAATGSPGAALGILADGREEHAVFGRASIDGGEPVAADTLFATGSITKTVTATAAMRLVDDGMLDLEATVRTYLPELRLADNDVAERVTVRHLLTHTGGWWGDLFADTGDGDDAVERYVERWFPALPQLSPLGEFFSYNNAGFILLGRLVETLTGQEYRAAVDGLVFQPLGMDGSFYAPEQITGRPHALGHFVEDGSARLQDPLFLPRSVEPAGGLWSTTRELLRYARFHLGDGTVLGAPVLSEELLTLMQTPQQSILGDPTTAMALPWFIVDLPGQRFVLHDGGTFGQHAQLWLAPDRDFAVALLVNALPAGALAAQAAVGEMLSQYFGFDPGAAAAATPMSTPVAPPATPPPTDLEQYVGSYATPDATTRLELVGGAPVLSFELHPHPAQVQPSFVPDLPAETPMEFIAEDVALMTIAGIPIPIVFVRNDGGDVGWISSGLRLAPKVA